MSDYGLPLIVREFFHGQRHTAAELVFGGRPLGVGGQIEQVFGSFKASGPAFSKLVHGRVSDRSKHVCLEVSRLASQPEQATKGLLHGVFSPRGTTRNGQGANEQLRTIRPEQPLKSVVYHPNHPCESC